MISKRNWSNEDEGLYQLQVEMERSRCEECRCSGYEHFEGCSRPAQQRAIEKRIAIERRMCRAAVKGLLAAGYFVTVNDGEEDTVKRSRSLAQIMAALMTTDEDWLKAYPPPGWMELRHGWVRLIYGNDGWDVIADYTVNLEPALAIASALSDRICEQLG